MRAWNNTYGIPTIISNCSNNYGPFQFPDKLIPVIILSALHEKSIPIYGTGENIRDWLFVDDHVDALLTLLKRGQIGKTYNIGGENECSNLELAQRICCILDRLRPRSNGSYSNLITFVDDRPGHDARYAIDSSLIKKELNWQPAYSIERGLEVTVKWYLKNTEWWKPLLAKQDLGTRLGRSIK